MIAVITPEPMPAIAPLSDRHHSFAVTAVKLVAHMDTEQSRLGACLKYVVQQSQLRELPRGNTENFAPVATVDEKLEVLQLYHTPLAFA